MRDLQSHGKSCGTIFTSFKHPFLNDPRGVAGPTGLCSAIVLDSCSSFVVFTAQRNAQLRTTANVDFSSLPSHCALVEQPHGLHLMFAPVLLPIKNGLERDLAWRAAAGLVFRLTDSLPNDKAL